MQVNVCSVSLNIKLIELYNLYLELCSPDYANIGDKDEAVSDFKQRIQVNRKQDGGSIKPTGVITPQAW